MAGCTLNRTNTVARVDYGICDDPRTLEKGDGVLRPITYSVNDTDETVMQVQEHNSVYEELCPSKGS